MQTDNEVACCSRNPSPSARTTSCLLCAVHPKVIKEPTDSVKLSFNLGNPRVPTSIQEQVFSGHPGVVPPVLRCVEMGAINSDKIDVPGSRVAVSKHRLVVQICSNL